MGWEEDVVDDGDVAKAVARVGGCVCCQEILPWYGLEVGKGGNAESGFGGVVKGSRGCDGHCGGEFWGSEGLRLHYCMGNWGWWCAVKEGLDEDGVVGFAVGCYVDRRATKRRDILGDPSECSVL